MINYLPAWTVRNKLCSNICCNVPPLSLLSAPTYVCLFRTWLSLSYTFLSMSFYICLRLSVCTHVFLCIPMPSYMYPCLSECTCVYPFLWVAVSFYSLYSPLTVYSLAVFYNIYLWMISLWFFVTVIPRFLFLKILFCYNSFHSLSPSSFSS